MPRINGDLRPISSGIGHLGINAAGETAFDMSTLTPFGHIHQLSGVFHDPLLGESGVLRYSRAAAAFQISVDGGLTFSNLSTAAPSVTSIGVIGDVNLTGHVDLATVASGFMTIEDTGDASPLIFSVNTLGLSGLFGFPTQGFNGRVVNALTDANGTEVQGVVQIVGASGIVVDAIGQVFTITPGNGMPKCYTNTYSSATSWVIAHNLGSLFPIVYVFDNGSPKIKIEPDDMEVTDSNTVTIRWNQAQAGSASVIVC